MTSPQDLDQQFSVHPGAKWRIRTRGPEVELKDQGVLDELVIDHWLHFEQMTERTWVMRLGDARLTIEISQLGSPVLDVERGFYRPVAGTTSIVE